MFQDFEGRPSRKYGVKWSDAPISMVFSFPYLIAVLPKSVEVHLIETQNAVQTISLRANTITPSPHDDAAFVLANNQIYRLRPVPIHRQLDMLMEAKNFETAVRCRPHPGPRAIDERARTQKYTTGTNSHKDVCMHKPWDRLIVADHPANLLATRTTARKGMHRCGCFASNLLYQTISLR